MKVKQRLVPICVHLVKGRRGHLLFSLVLILSAGLNLAGITWGLPHYLDWGIDSVAPFKVLKAAYYRFSNGWFDVYPPWHLVILAMFYAPYVGYLIVSGELTSPSQVFPFGFADPLSALTNMILLSRVVSAFMGVAIVFLTYLVVQNLFDRRSAFFASFIVALYYPLIYYAHNANLDVPYLFWSLLAIYSFLRILQENTLKDCVLFALFGTLAICTKDQAYGLFLLAPLPIFWMRFAELPRSSRQPARIAEIIFDKKYILAAIVAVATFVLVQNLVFNFSGFMEHVWFITGPARQEYVTHESTLIGRLQLLGDMITLLAYGLTPPLFGICAIGAFYCVRRFPKYTLPILFLAVSYYLIFLNVSLQMKHRFVLPIGIILAFFGGKLLADLWHKGPWRTLTRIVIGLVFVYAFLFPMQLDFLFMRESRYAAEQWMHEHFQQGALVETFSPFHHYNKYPRFPSWVKVRSSDLAKGTQWEPQPTRPDRIRLPNMHTGREAPDYVILSEFWYDQFLRAEMANTDQARVLNEFFQDRTGYTLVVTFKAPTVVPIRRLPLNPTIHIFKKR